MDIHLIKFFLRDLVQNYLVVLFVETSILFNFFELLLALPSVSVLLAVIDKFREVSFASVFDTQNMLILEQNMDDMLSLFFVTAQNLDGFIVVLVSVNSLEVDLSHIELVHDPNLITIERMSSIMILLSNPNIDDHLVKIVDIWELGFDSAVSKH